MSEHPQNHHGNIRSQFAQRIQTYEHAAAWMLNEDLIRVQREAAGPVRGGKDQCLDLCCGTGIVGRNLLDLGWKVKGLDLTPEMAHVASEHFPVKIGSIENIEMPDASFDLAILRQSFMLVNGDKALREIHRVLKPGGRFILIQSVSFSDADDAVYRQVQEARHINMLTYYRDTDLEQTLRAHGFSIAGNKTLRVKESVDHWLDSAPELGPDLRSRIRGLIADAPHAYKEIRHVHSVDGELFEDWNWQILTGQKEEGHGN
jgi:ubiquinone/menaquinone biosynthesis C-methylase UbiE